MIMNIQNTPTSSNSQAFENNPEDQSNINQSIRILFQNNSILASAPSNTDNTTPETSLKRSFQTFTIQRQQIFEHTTQSNAQKHPDFNFSGEKLAHTDEKSKENNIDELSADVMKSQQRLDTAIENLKKSAKSLQAQIHAGRPLANHLKQKNAYKKLRTTCEEDLKIAQDRLKSVTGESSISTHQRASRPSDDWLHCNETP
jgi:hypothetical protein